MIELVISIDYELFGNGGGDVQRDIVEPTSRLLAICDRHSAKLTIMFEIGQYWAMKQAEQALQHDLGYSPAKAMEMQIQRALGSGHDVQLHLHPQWIGAEYRDRLWHLNFQRIRVCDLDDAKDRDSATLSLVDILRRGKETLESLLRSVDSGYECSAFRAGGFYIEPAERVIETMRRVGLWADSSVVPGYVADEPLPIDFGSAPPNAGYWWTSRRSMTERGQDCQGVLEFPLYAEMKPYFWNFKLSKFRATLKRRALEKQDPHCRVRSAPRSTASPRSVLRKLFSKNAMKFDICKLSTGDMCRMFAAVVEKQAADPCSGIYPVVCLGHSKDFWNDAALDAFLRKISSHRKYRSAFRWNTLGGIVRQILATYGHAVGAEAVIEE
jgi:hypothetical protein